MKHLLQQLTFLLMRQKRKISEMYFLFLIFFFYHNPILLLVAPRVLIGIRTILFLFKYSYYFCYFQLTESTDCYNQSERK